MSISVLGAGAFGTALAITFARTGSKVSLWGRDPNLMQSLSTEQCNKKYLPNASFPPSIKVSQDLENALEADIILFAVPTQKLARLLGGMGHNLDGKLLVACCKGIDLRTGQGPTSIVSKYAPDCEVGILTGPSFATDLAANMPTALTLACNKTSVGKDLQSALATPVLRIYTTTDVIGAELGGALKNVMAIACGICIGAGFGDSARAALMTRGYAEMLRLALAMGAKAETLSGLSGLGDLSLTCMSESSRNFRYGLALGRGKAFDPSITVEGVATAHAALGNPQFSKVDMPITKIVHEIANGTIDADGAMQNLMNRPQKEE
jgi:glycerol-3-phosphate dehydrogenase (NAD(P)+)